MQRSDIASILGSLYIPNQLLVYLIHLRTNQYYRGNVVFGLKFMSPNILLFKEYTVQPEDKPKLKVIADDRGIDRVFL